jgi:hypothetical protein
MCSDLQSSPSHGIVDNQTVILHEGNTKEEDTLEGGYLEWCIYKNLEKIKVEEEMESFSGLDCETSD